MKFKLIAAALASTMVSAPLKLDFNGNDLKSKIDNICGFTQTIDKATKTINELINSIKELSSENDKLQKDINDLNDLNSKINYSNLPSMDETFGNETSKEINKLINYTGSASYPNKTAPYLINIVNYYYKIQYEEQMLKYYQYLYNNESYYTDKDESGIYARNYLHKQEHSVKQLIHGSGKNIGYMGNMINNLNFLNNEYKKELNKNPQNVDKITIPVKDQINMNDGKLLTDIKLPPDINKDKINLQAKLDECKAKLDEAFDKYTDYFKNNNAKNIYNKIPNIYSSLGQYPNVLMNAYYIRYYNYLYNHPELLPKGLTKKDVEGKISYFVGQYSTSCEAFNRQFNTLKKQLK